MTLLALYLYVAGFLVASWFTMVARVFWREGGPLSLALFLLLAGAVYAALWPFIVADWFAGRGLRQMLDALDGVRRAR